MEVHATEQIHRATDLRTNFIVCYVGSQTHERSFLLTGKTTTQPPSRRKKDAPTNLQKTKMQKPRTHTRSIPIRPRYISPNILRTPITPLTTKTFVQTTKATQNENDPNERSSLLAERSAQINNQRVFRRGPGGESALRQKRFGKQSFGKCHHWNCHGRFGRFGEKEFECVGMGRGGSGNSIFQEWEGGGEVFFRFAGYLVGGNVRSDREGGPFFGDEF
mmetsp:Transcript_9541/g.20230  ORF Transcript_9541/g.20230 Transcript_9541/m.20230 type:complete len:219 (-) Transcript_9541:281-937(-)